MKYSVVEEDKLIKPLYKSNFPFVKRTKWDPNGSSARIVKQFMFRRSLNLYIDDVETYRAIGGLFGASKVERFRASDYPSWSQLTGISSYAFPDFANRPVIQGGYFPDSFLIKDIEQDNDLVIIHTEPLKNTDTTATLTKVRTVSFDYVKSWGVTIDKESAEREENKANKWFISKLGQEGITSIQGADSLIGRILKADSEDTGIVRKSKAYDFYKMRCLAQKQIKSDIRDEMCFLDGFFFQNDIWKAAQRLYNLKGDFPFYDVYDDALVDKLVSSLGKLVREADYLWKGICNHTVDVAWAKEKLNDIKSEWNEASFPFERRGDTGSQWKRYNELFKLINSK